MQVHELTDALFLVQEIQATMMNVKVVYAIDENVSDKSVFVIVIFVTVVVTWQT